MIRMRYVLLTALAVSISLTSLAEDTRRETANPTPLDEYVFAPDDSYGFELAGTHDLGACTAYVLDLTSQTWRSEDAIDRTVWKHWLTIFVPDDREGDTAMLVISGGGNGGEAPKPEAQIAQVAIAGKSVLANLAQIPNQPLSFTTDGTPRKEDDFIAYTWAEYIQTGDPTVLARMPMTKAAVRAMDAVQTFLASSDGGNIAVDEFVVAGASKRGWTTWTTAIVDKRVVAIAPMVIDMLNLVPSFEHHWKATGQWAPAVGDYLTHGVFDWMGHPEFNAMMEIVEPYHYRDRLDMPKYLINSAGDQFFLPDSAQFYWDDLPGPKYLRCIPNTGHGLDLSAYFSAAAFLQSVAWGKPMPEYTWSKEADGTIRVETKTKPSAVKLWTATNPEARVFNIDVVGKIWESQPMEIAADGVYTAKPDAPANGYTAYFIELTYPGPALFPIVLTSGIAVTPDEYPFEYQRAPRPEGGFMRQGN